MIGSLLITPVERSYLHADMRKFETSQKEESRAQSADSSKAYIENLRELSNVHYLRVSYFFRLVRIECN